MLGANLRHESLQRTDEGRFAEGSPHFDATGFPMISRHTNEAGICQRLEQVDQIDVELRITFASECQHGIWSAFDSAVNQPREMHAEEWELRIGHGVNQIAAEMLPFRLEFKVFAAK